MRVPVIALPGEMPHGGAPNLHVEQAGGFDSIARGLAAVGQAADTIQAGIEKEQHEASVVEARDNLTEYQHETTDTLHGTSKPTPADAADAAFAGREAETGFLSTKGKEAAAQSADTLDELEQKRQKRAEAITNPKARKLFLQSSAEAYETTRRTVESHVSQQIEQAKVDSIAAAEDEAVRAAALEPGNDKLAQERIASVVGAVSGLGRGQEYNDVQALKVQQKVAATRLDALLFQGDAAQAERVLDANKWALGDHLDDYRKKLDNLKSGGEAQTAAFDIVNGALGPDGQVNQSDVLAALAKVPADKRAKVEPVAYRLMAEREQAYIADTKRISTAAFTLYNAKGWGEFQKSPIAEELNARDPALYDRLRNEARASFDRTKKHASDDAAARREAAALQKQSLHEFKGLPDPEMAEAGAVEKHLAQFPWASPEERDRARAALLPEAKKAATRVQSGASVKREEFVQDAVHEMASWEKGSKQQVAKEEKRMRAAAAIAYDELESELKRAPTKEETTKRVGALIIEQQTAPRTLESVFGKGKERGYQRLLRERSAGVGPADAPAEPPPAQKPPLAERAAALKASGVSREDSRKILKSEGY